MKKQPIKTALALLLEAAAAGATAWRTTLNAMIARYAEEKTAIDKLATGEEKQKALTRWARTALKDTPGSWDTISGYCRKGASIALVPNAIGSIRDGVGDNAPTREVTLKNVTTRRELSALAEGANKRLGIKKKEGSGRTETPQTPEEKAKAETALAIESAMKNAKANQKLADDADKGASQTIVQLIKKSFDGKHPHMRQAVLDGLSACGFALVSKEAGEKIVKAAKKAATRKPANKATEQHAIQ